MGVRCENVTMAQSLVGKLTKLRYEHDNLRALEN